MPRMKSFLCLDCLLWTCPACPLAYIFLLGRLCVLRPGRPRCPGRTVGRPVWGPILTSELILEVRCRTWPGQACFLSMSTSPNTG